MRRAAVPKHLLTGISIASQGAVVAQLQAELQSCRDQVGAQSQAVAAVIAERDACRASASESADRAKVPSTMNCSAHMRASQASR